MLGEKASPDSAPDEVDACMGVEAEGLPGMLRTVQFAKDEAEEGLDSRRPIVGKDALAVIRHPTQGEFPAVVELQVWEARQVRFARP